MRVLLLSGFFWAVCASAAPALTLRGEVVRDGPPLRRLADGVTDFAITADGKAIVFQHAEGLSWAPPGGAASRVENSVAPYFRLTPSARFALVPGGAGAWTRLPLGGAKDGRADLAKGLALHQLTGTEVSDRHVAFIAADGSLQLTDLLEGTSRELPLEQPTDGRCHAGKGYPRAFSSDGAWLVYQHGCVHHVMRVDTGEKKELGFADARLVGTLVVGDVRPPGSTEDPTSLEVFDLKRGARWTIDGIRLDPLAVVVPGAEALLMLTSQGTLKHVDLREKKVSVLAEGVGWGMPLDVTPDGKTAVFAKRSGDGWVVRALDLKTLKGRQVLEVTGADQCMVKALGPSSAVVTAWRSAEGGALVAATVDLKSLVATRLGPPLPGLGNLQAVRGTWAVAAGSALYVPK